MDEPDAVVFDTLLVPRARRSIVAGLGGAAAVATYAALRLEPAFANLDDEVGPHYVEVVNVKDFKAKGDGIADDILFIEAAIKAAKDTHRPVYFPAGTYVISRPLDVAGCRLMGARPHGEPNGVARMSTIRADKNFQGKTKFHAGVPLVYAGPKKAPVFIDGLTLDARHRADIGFLGLALDRASVIQSLWISGARSDGLFLISSPRIQVSDVVVMKSGGHGLHFRDCDGAQLRNFHVGGFGKVRSNASAILVKGAADGRGAIYMRNGTIDGVAGGGPGLRFSGLKTPGHSTSIHIRISGLSDGIVLQKTSYQVIVNCWVSSGGDPNPRSIAIRLMERSCNNVLRSNMVDFSHNRRGEQIAIGPGCDNNHIQDNLLSRPGSSSGALAITYTGGSSIPSERNHTLGQKNVITHASSPPASGLWRVGDIVFNSDSKEGGPAGWIYAKPKTEPAAFKPFGTIGPAA